MVPSQTGQAANRGNRKSLPDTLVASGVPAFTAQFYLIPFSLAVLAAVLAPLAAFFNSAVAGRMRALGPVRHRNLLTPTLRSRCHGHKEDRNLSRVELTRWLPISIRSARSRLSQGVRCAATLASARAGLQIMRGDVTPDTVGRAPLHPFDEAAIQRVLE